MLKNGEISELSLSKKKDTTSHFSNQVTFIMNTSIGEAR